MQAQNIFDRPITSLGSHKSTAFCRAIPYLTYVRDNYDPSIARCIVRCEGYKFTIKRTRRYNGMYDYRIHTNGKHTADVIRATSYRDYGTHWVYENSELPIDEVNRLLEILYATMVPDGAITDVSYYRSAPIVQPTPLQPPAYASSVIEGVLVGVVVALIVIILIASGARG